MAYTIVLTGTDTSTEPVAHLTAKKETQENNQGRDKRDQQGYGESSFIHGVHALLQQAGIKHQCCEHTCTFSSHYIRQHNERKHNNNKYHQHLEKVTPNDAVITLQHMISPMTVNSA